MYVISFNFLTFLNLRTLQPVIGLWCSDRLEKEKETFVTVIGKRQKQFKREGKIIFFFNVRCISGMLFQPLKYSLITMPMEFTYVFSISVLLTYGILIVNG